MPIIENPSVYAKGQDQADIQIRLNKNTSYSPKRFNYAKTGFRIISH